MPPVPAPRANPPRTAGWLRAAAWLALCLFSWHGSAGAQAGHLEREIKAAYLYKFGGFVEWPEGSFAAADSPLQIGVAGNDALADQLEHMVAGRNVNGHPLAVRRLRRGDALTGLHILYVGPMERAAQAELLNSARGLALLTVSDTADAAAGSMINFVVAEDKLRFEVALRHVNGSRLRISARMLAAAIKVVGGAS